MRSEDGKYLQNVVGVTDRNIETGEEFDADVVKSERTLNPGDKLTIGGVVYTYFGEDSLKRSLFGKPGETVASVVTGGFPRPR